jgi:hypothetical protein
MTRAANPARCRDCGAKILVGIDSHRAGLIAVVDTEPLTRTGELLAVCAGRRVYAQDLHGWLMYRNRWRLRSPTRRVLAEHRCGEEIPETWRQPPDPARPATRTKEVLF